MLGGKCVLCGSVVDLTFDCILPRGGAHHAKEVSSRMAFYAREMAAGNLQLLCRRCNGEKQDKVLPRYLPV